MATTHNIQDYAPKLNGRQKGVKNKKTELREQMLEEQLMKNDRIFQLVDYIFEGMTDGTLRKSEAVKAFSTFSTYLFRTLAERTHEEITDHILSKEDADKEMMEILATVHQMRAK